MVCGGDWFGKPANIKVENNCAVVYVGSSLTVHNPFFSQIVTEWISAMFLLVRKFKMIGMVLNLVQGQVQKNT